MRLEIAFILRMIWRAPNLRVSAMFSKGKHGATTKQTPETNFPDRRELAGSQGHPPQIGYTRLGRKN